MKIDPGSHVPIYLQIAAEIRSAVAAEVYRPGEALPSLRNMAIELQVNPNTVQRAYDELVRDGLIYPQRGRGLFVADQGTTSAQNGALEVVRMLFEEGVRAGRAAGVSADQLREIFSASMNKPANKGATSHDQ